MVDTSSVSLTSAPIMEVHPGGCSCCCSGVSAMRERELVDRFVLETTADCVSSDDRVSELGADAVEFGVSNGILLEKRDGSYHYYLDGDSSKKLLFSTDASTDGLKEATAKLEELIQKKIESLEHDYKVRVAQQGEEVVRRWVQKDDSTWERGPFLKARKPTLKELVGVDMALWKSQPSQLIDSASGGIKFYFLESEFYSTGSAAYFVHRDKAGDPAVYFDPVMTKGKPILEVDSEKLGKSLQYSIEAVTIHELAHNGQKSMGWHDKAANYEKFASQIGWVSFEDPGTHETEWLLKGKDCEYFRRVRESSGKEKVWVRVGLDGNPLTAEGLRADSISDAKKYSVAEVRDLAEVRPGTDYFVSPIEMFAEGMMLLRLGPKQRGELLTKSPALYRAVLSHDKAEILAAYGSNRDGSPRWLRKPNGFLAENSEKVRKIIDDFERSQTIKIAESKIAER